MGNAMMLYPGITRTAAARMERIAGSYAALSDAEQLAFTEELRAARQRGARVKSIKGKVENNGTGEQGFDEASAEVPRSPGREDDGLSQEGAENS
jgi:hypothetical protein